MTVKELITLLASFPEDLPVCYELYSEQCLLRSEQVVIVELQPPRPDGWVHDLRPDKPKMQYLCFPGN